MTHVDAYVKFISEESRKLKSSTIFSEQEVVKAEPVKAKPVKPNTELDSELEDEPGINPGERGAKFGPMVKSPEYMDYLRQNQDKIRAKKAQPANPVKPATSTSTSTDIDAL